MNIPEEAVEAAGKAGREAAYWHAGGGKPALSWDKTWPTDRDLYRSVARAALEAAAPLLMAQALQEMAETFEPMNTEPIKSWHPHDVAELLRWRAADITP